MELNERLQLFHEMLSCCHNLYLWDYDCALHLISTNCPERETMHNLFTLAVNQSDFSQQVSCSDTPILLTGDTRIMWVAVPQFEHGEMIRVHALGPFFMDDTSAKAIRSQLSAMGITAALCAKVADFLDALPIISWSRIQEYTMMLYFMINRRKTDISELRYCNTSKVTPGSASGYQSAHEDAFEVHGTYQAEQEMLRMVREGDLHLTTHLERMSWIGNMGKLSNGDSMRQMKNMTLVCTILFSRAAIEGGLSPELSLTLTDRYFQAVEASRNLSELTEITRGMQADFVQRVHRCRNAQLSRPIQMCCDSISLHLEEEIKISELAQQTGYTEYYLSKKFKKETGMILADYIRQKRLDQAAILLRNSQEEIQEIGSRLMFGTHSYFSECFKKQFGMTPSEYRDNKG